MKRFIIILIISMMVNYSGVSLSEEIPAIKKISLEQSIDYALKNNHDFLAKEEELKMAKEKVSIAWSQALPSLSLSGTYTDYQNHPYLSYNDNIDASISASQTLFSGGKIFNTIKQSKFNLKATEENKRRTKQLVIFKVKQDFYQVLLNKKKLNIQEESLARASVHLRTTRARYEAGEVSQYDVLRAEVEAAKIKPELIKAENNLNVAKNQFKFTLGMNLNSEVELEGDFKYQPEQKEKKQLLERALAVRPELKRMEAFKNAAQAGVKRALAGYLPTVSLNCTDYFSEKAAFSSGRDEYDDYLVSYVLVSLPVFDGFLTRAKVKESQAQLKELKIKEEQLIETVKFEMENAFLSLNAAREVVESQTKNVERAQKGYEIMQTRYKHGKATQLDLLDAQLSLSTAKLNYVQGLYEHIMAKAALVKVTGEER